MGRRRTYKPRPKPEPELLINEQIRHPEVRVIGQTGENLGVMPTAAALQRARDAGLDLVEIVPIATPPVTKITDYGKLRYERQKEARKKRAGSQESEVKGIRVGLGTSSHDVEFKAKQATAFLSQNHKIRLEVRLRGREKAHQDLARQRIQEFMTRIPMDVVMEQEPQRSHWGLTVIFRRK